MLPSILMRLHHRNHHHLPYTLLNVLLRFLNKHNADFEPRCIVLDVAAGEMQRQSLKFWMFLVEWEICKCRYVCCRYLTRGVEMKMKRVNSIIDLFLAVVVRTLNPPSLGQTFCGFVQANVVQGS
jgi:hypothetical protein